jgi:ABC-2 type transport system ATP-binding protein
MTHIIQTENLTRQFGSLTAVDSVNLQIKQGEIYGFLGLNGAGKTTAIRMLLGMIRPTSGSAFLFGTKVAPGNTGLWNKVGHLVEIPYAYPSLTVKENLEIFRRLRFIGEPGAIGEVAAMLHLEPYMNTKAKNLSLGNAQRLGLAKALIHKPGLLILDEPANGLDPYGILQTRELLSDLAANHGVTIFISSHILGEISRLATRIGIIHQGKMIRESETDQLQSHRQRAVHVNTLNNQKAMEILIKQQYQPRILPDGTIEMKEDKAIDHPENISQTLVSMGFPPTRIAVEEEDLEHFFFRIIQQNNS